MYHYRHFDILVKYIYFSFQVPPGDGANHHYRSCRYEWHELSVKEKQNQFGNRTQCDEFRRYYSTDMLLVAQAIGNNVLQIINDLQLPTKLNNVMQNKSVVVSKLYNALFGVGNITECIFTASKHALYNEFEDD
jgi:hypothetical protein